MYVAEKAWLFWCAVVRRMPSDREHEFSQGGKSTSYEHVCLVTANSGSAFSSLLSCADAAAEFAEAAVITYPGEIEVRTLNEIVSALSDNTLLMIDTQGYEKQVLEGGRQTLSGLKGVLMELPIVHLYEG